MGSSAGTLASVSLGSQIVGGVMSTVGTYGSAKSQKSALQAQARMSDMNVNLAELGAQDALRKGNADVAALTLQYAQLKGQQRVALAANGVDLGEGSAAEVQVSNELMKDIDVDTLLSNAMRSAWGYRTEATNYRNEALASRASAKGISPGLAGATSLLSSAGSVADSWYKLSKSGVWDEKTVSKKTYSYKR